MYVDIAIVGGGVAGTYAAWRLARTSPKILNEALHSGSGEPSIHLFEATRAVGGRLLTVRMPGMDFQAELGGMRYTSSHILLKHTIPQLDLHEKEFGFEDRLMYLRGKHLKVGSIPDGRCETCLGPRGIPYKLADGEAADPIKLAKSAIVSALKKVQLDAPSAANPTETTNRELASTKAIIAELDDKRIPVNKQSLTCREWALVKRYGTLESRCLYQLGFWNLLQRFLSSEAFLLVRDALGYESVFANWNAAEAIPWFLADFGVEYFTIREGLGAVPEYLATLFQGRNPELTHIKHELQVVEQVRHNGESLLRLVFKDKDPVLARTVILALPKEVLLSDVKLNLGRDREELEFKQVLKNSVTAHPLFKLFLAYDRPWWQDARALGTESGRATTDLPIRQVYYYPAAKGDTGGSRGVVMASYSDEHYVDFWRPLVKRPGMTAYHRAGDRFDTDGEALLGAWGATEPMLQKAQRQIRELHPELSSADGIPPPYAGIVRDWSDPPFYGGWHSWNPHVRSWEVVNQLIRPFKQLNLFTCGEAFSTEQGWVEGALKSAELVLSSLAVPLPKVPQKAYDSARAAGYADYIES